MSDVNRPTGSVRGKAIEGLFWSFGDNAVNQVIHFGVGIVLARLLTPSEFGLIGMLTVFIAISQSFVDSGFQQALIRKRDADNSDFSTVFFFNILLGLLFYLLLYISSGSISRFYGEPQLSQILKVFGLLVVINALALIQRVRLTREINFKLQTKISLVCSLTSGLAGIWLALSGYGVWSLVWRTLLNQLFQTVALWLFNRWRPIAVFSISSLREMFSFGSKLLVAGLIDTIYRNIYLLIIGRFFSAADLGFYTRADQFMRLSSTNITRTVQRVSYPVLASINDNRERLRSGYRKIIISTMFISFSIMIVLASVAKPLIVVLIGEKWLPSVALLQMLCFAGMLYPLHSINLNVLNVSGRSDLFLRLEIIKKMMAVPVIVTGIYFGLHIMIGGMIVISFLATVVNSYYSGTLIGYPLRQQLSDIFQSFLIALLAGGVSFLLSRILDLNLLLMLIIQLKAAGVILIVVSELSNQSGYGEVKGIVLKQARKLFMN